MQHVVHITQHHMQHLGAVDMDFYMIWNFKINNKHVIERKKVRHRRFAEIYRTKWYALDIIANLWRSAEIMIIIMCLWSNGSLATGKIRYNDPSLYKLCNISSCFVSDTINCAFQKDWIYVTVLDWPSHLFNFLLCMLYFSFLFNTFYLI